MSDVAVGNTSSGLSGKTILATDVDATVTGLHTFNRGAGSPPFAVNSGATAVSNLDADKVDGIEGTALATKTGSEVLTNKTLTAPAISQVVFPGTQDPSTDVNTLDDYEEGTWTPVIGGSGGTSGQTYTTQVGAYVKIGKLVTVQYLVQLSAKGTITTNVQIQGLPFASENTTNLYSIGAMQWFGLATTWVNVISQLLPSTSALNVIGAQVAAVSQGALATADIANTSIFVGTHTYRASA